MIGNPVRTRPVGGSNPTRWTAVVWLAAATSTVLLVGLVSVASRADAVEAPVGLGTAGTYSVLGGQTVTNTGPSSLSGDLGVSPGTAVVGFPPGTVGGATHAGDAQAAQAQSDLVIAYDDAAGRAPTASVAGDLVGQTLTTGVYNSTGPLALSGTLTLDGQGDPNAVFIFQIASTLITASASNVNLINGAQACNVFWQVGSSATLGTTSSFKGTIMALTSISVTTGTVVEGRALARNGQVSLDNNTFTAPDCGATTTTTTTAPTTTPTTVPAAAPATAVAATPSFTG
jgi:Ice-binding-like